MAEETSQVNAFSCWRRGVTPFVFLNTQKSAEASRFDAAHELGHLVLHRHGENKGKRG
ncbi:ImmA/IrrE family metallo-endopeptidase [Pseudomonas aeruginosa]